MIGVRQTAIFVSGAYILRGYVRDRLEEVKFNLERERMDREALKRRFHDTQENISYTVLALIQTLSDQISQEMDVDRLTSELKDRSQARHAIRKHTTRPPSSVSSSIDVVHDQDMRSETDSVMLPAASTSYHITEESASSMGGSSLQSWVASSESSLSQEGHQTEVEQASCLVTNEVSTPNGESSSVADSSESAMTSSMISNASQGMTTAEIWREVKILTFTRAITTLYSATLLSLLTSIQLTLLARSKYIQSVTQQEREERLQEQLESAFTLENILMGASSGKIIEDLFSENVTPLKTDEEFVNEEVENKFLTMSWWLLHVGWKNIGERVRRSVEEVFESVSLKSKLPANDLRRLVVEVRRKVEHEVTFEGQQRRTNFLSSLLPSTPELVQHVLTQGGYTSSMPEHHEFFEYEDTSATSSQNLHPQNSAVHEHITAYAQEPAFLALLDETRDIIVSSDFSCVLEQCLDCATEALFEGLEKHVFVQSEPYPPGEPVRIRLAGMLPGIARWSNLALNAIPNELVDNILAVREASCLSVIAFEKFEDQFH